MNLSKLLVAIALVGGTLLAGASSRHVAPDLPRPPDAIISQAFSSYSAGNYDEVIAQSSKALLELPVAAWGLLGAAQCKRQDAKAASHAYAKLRRLNAADANFVRSTCESRGVTLPEAG
jgi:hypothetical protein